MPVTCDAGMSEMDKPEASIDGGSSERKSGCYPEAAAAAATTPALPHGAETSAKLRGNIERIAAYTAEHAELRRAHHWLYDLRSPPVGKPNFVIMGINPGESPSDWEAAPEPTEETSRYDWFEDKKRSRSSIRWSQLAAWFLDAKPYVMAELFLWSSRDMKEFVERFGALAASPHLPFCREMNLDIITAYQPKAVILPGLGSAKLCASLYGLRHCESIHEGGARVAETYTDGERPWLFTKHWTGSFGLSAAQKERIRTAIRAAA